MKTQKIEERIVSESGIDIVVTYSITQDSSTEECHGVHFLYGSEINIEWVEMFIEDTPVQFERNGKKTTNMLHSLSEDQISKIINQLSIY
jgi:hypothetical protein